MPSRVNRFSELMSLIPGYWFHAPQKRFAQEAGISESSLSRLLRDDAPDPRYEAVCRAVDLLERKLGRKIDPREVFRP